MLRRSESDCKNTSTPQSCIGVPDSAESLNSSLRFSISKPKSALGMESRRFRPDGRHIHGKTRGHDAFCRHKHNRLETWVNSVFKGTRALGLGYPDDYYFSPLDRAGLCQRQKYSQSSSSKAQEPSDCRKLRVKSIGALGL